MRLLLLARHGQSLFNVDRVVNGDPQLDRGLSPLGIDEARKLHGQIAGISIDLCVVSEFPRAQQTARLALDGRDGIPFEVDPDLNDIRIGELEGRTLDEYRHWKQAHGDGDPFPGGESLGGAAHRYGAAYARVLGHDEGTILCVCHEIPVRYAINAAAGSTELDWPTHAIANATPYVFDAAGLERAVRRLASKS
ncbi:MAG: histidine phosphatase family protein [Actinomycetia bacterium]|nr:histidine phosphatase family protein [Actinomycetes bacterium]